jgi:DNA-binding response OmpR family regulator
MRVLVVEDEARIASFVTKGLRAQGFAVEHAATAAEAFEGVLRAEPDLIVLDLGLPDVDGTQLLTRLRDAGHFMPVLILTARGEVADRVKSLNLGADDYLTKPFAFDELLARIRARLRRRDEARTPTVRVGEVELDLRTRRVSVDGRPVDLTAREFSLLETLLRHPGQVLSRQQLLSGVWGFSFDPGSNLVDVYVGYLRRKLGEGRIETVRGAGYRLVAEGAR